MNKRIIFVVGDDEFIRTKEAKKLSEKTAHDASLPIIPCSFESYEKGTLEKKISPSLFFQKSLLTINADDINSGIDIFTDDLNSVISDPASDDFFLIISLSGSQKKLLALAKNAEKNNIKCDDGSNFIEIRYCENLKTVRAKQSFIQKVFKENNKNISAGGIELLINYLGEDVNLLISCVYRLINDTEGKTVSDDEIKSLLFNSFPDAQVFKIADYVISGNTKSSLILTRQAIKAGTSSVQILSAISYKLRQIAQVKNNDTDKIQPWALQRLKRDARMWNEKKYVYALRLLHDYDVRSKSSKTSDYDIEQVILKIAEAVKR